MAEVLGKTNLFPCCNLNQKNSMSVLGKSCSVKGCFPSVNLKSEGFRLAASSNSGFYGNRVVFQDAKGLEDVRVSSRSSIYAQVGLLIWLIL